MRRQLCILLAAAALVAGSEPRAIAQSTDEVVFRQLEDAVTAYLSFQRRLKSEVPALEVSASAENIGRSSDVLAVAIQRSRPKAQPGDFFDAASARAITARLRQALEGEDVVHFLAVINDEPTQKAPPRIYMRFPGASSMATMPTNILEVLPALPEELEYRFIGRYLILRDRDAALILDFIGEALPAR